MIVIFLILLILKSSSSLKVGYVSTDLNTDEYNLLNKYVDLINPQLTNKIDFIDLAYTGPGDTRFASLISQTDLTVAFGVCNGIVDDELAGYIASNGTVLWCTDIYSNGDCMKNRIHGISILPAVEKCIIYIL